MERRKIKSALISVYYKDHLEPILRQLHALGTTIYSTGGTQQFIESLGIPVIAVENLTSYPSILDGRVKTLHPKIFGGILAKREPDHAKQLSQHEIPEIDLVVVDLYPFEETVANTTDEAEIIEKIDIGGISLIRAAAKNFRDVVVIPSKNEYEFLLNLLKNKLGESHLEERQELARRAFKVSSHYDTAIYNYFNRQNAELGFKHSIHQTDLLRYGENPHQSGAFFGNFEAMFEKHGGKEMSYNNLLDIDAAVTLMNDFKDLDPTFAILKHNNSSGIATRPTLLEAWQAALACDPVSAFGGILIANRPIDISTASEINQLFYEVVIAPAYSPEALELLTSKKQRIVLTVKDLFVRKRSFKSLLNGVVEQDTDLKTERAEELQVATKNAPSALEVEDLLFASRCVKHLKSNGIALVKNKQLIGMGCGQTSRVDALRQAIAKAEQFGFSLAGAVMASDAFFPFPDCVEIAHGAGITAVVQPGGSVKDRESIDVCNQLQMAMVMTGTRHFKH